MTKSKEEIIKQYMDELGVYAPEGSASERYGFEVGFDAALKYVWEKANGKSMDLAMLSPQFDSLGEILRIEDLRQICEIKDDNETTTTED